MVKKLILGTVQFGLNYGINNKTGKPTESEIKSILDLSYQNGISMLDTAEAYGNSQEAIGNYHRSSSNKFEIISKYHAERGDLGNGFLAHVKSDLDILEVKQLYGYFFHSFQAYETGFKQFINEIKEVKKKKWVKKIGVSVYTNQEFEAVLHNSEIELIQVPFNLLDNIQQRGVLLAEAKKNGIEVHSRSVFLQGLFFIDPEKIPLNLFGLKRSLQALSEIRHESQLSIIQLCLQYACLQPNIDKVLVGIDSENQLFEIISSMTATINPETVAAIESIEIDNVNLLNPATWNLK